MKARATRLAAVAAGHRPRYCPPKGSKRLGNQEFMDGMASIPQAERLTIDLTEAIDKEIRRIVEQGYDRAKHLLMSESGLSENEAHAKMQRSAMDGGVRMVDVAQRLIAAAERVKNGARTARA